MQALRDARKIVRSIEEIGFEMRPGPLCEYEHMGGLLCDVILQAGLNYESVVLPRIRHVVEKYPAARETLNFYDVIQTVGPSTVLKWRHHEKPRRLMGLTFFFVAQNVNTIPELKQWLSCLENLCRLKLVRGMGPKSVDYMCCLAGIQTVAVDRHLMTFLENLGVVNQSYDYAKMVISFAADFMEVPRRDLDQSIWYYMSSNLKIDSVTR